MPVEIPTIFKLDGTDTFTTLQFDFGYQNSTLTYSCRNYWAFTAGKNNTGLQTMTFSEKVAPSFVTQYTVLTLYTSVIFMVSTVLRLILISKSDRIPIENNHHTDQLLVMCEQIHIERKKGNLRREEDLMYVLLEIMRSTEKMIAFSGTTLRNTKMHD